MGPVKRFGDDGFVGMAVGNGEHGFTVQFAGLKAGQIGLECDVGIGIEWAAERLEQLF